MTIDMVVTDEMADVIETSKYVNKLQCVNSTVIQLALVHVSLVKNNKNIVNKNLNL